MGSGQSRKSRMQQVDGILVVMKDLNGTTARRQQLLFMVEMQAEPMTSRFNIGGRRDGRM